MAERSKTVDQALVLLLSLSEHGPDTVSGLARRTGVNRTVAHRLLATLGDRGMVRRTGSGSWRLGLALLDLATRIEADLRRVSRPVLDGLADQFGETVVLSIPDGDDLVAIDQALGERHPVRVAYRPGARHPLTRGAHGRAVLAFSEDAAITRALEREPDADAKRITTLLEQTRRLGYAVSHDELQYGASGLAVPVRGGTGTVIASLGMVAPVGRLPAEGRLSAAMLGAAATIARELDHETTSRTAS